MSSIVKESCEKIEEADEEKKFVTCVVVEKALLKYYKEFKGSVSVVWFQREKKFIAAIDNKACISTGLVNSNCSSIKYVIFAK